MENFDIILYFWKNYDNYLAPNNHGYFILTDSEEMNCIFSPEGDLVYRSANDLRISGAENYILEIYDEYVPGDEPGVDGYSMYEYRYLDAKGNELFTTGLCSYSPAKGEEFEAWARQRAAQYGLKEPETGGSQGAAQYGIQEEEIRDSQRILPGTGTSVMKVSGITMSHWMFLSAAFSGMATDIT